MDNFDIPIFKKSYDLYKVLNEYRPLIPKKDRYTIFQRCEQTTLDVIETILTASSQKKEEKYPTLKQASLKLNLLRVLIRLLKDIKSIDSKKYIKLENIIDEIGRMLGGWIRSTKNN